MQSSVRLATSGISIARHGPRARSEWTVGVVEANRNTATLDDYRRLLQQRLEEAEKKAARVEYLVKWQETLIKSLREEGRDLSQADEVMAILVESRNWFAELAYQAARDLNFVNRGTN